MMTDDKRAAPTAPLFISFVHITCHYTILQCKTFLFSSRVVCWQSMRRYFELLKKTWGILKPFHKEFYIQLAGITLDQLLGTLSILITAKLLDALVTKNTHFIPWFILLSVIVTVIRNQGVNYYKDSRATKRLDSHIQQHLEEYSFKKIFSLNPSQYHEGHSSIKLQVISRGESAIENIVTTSTLTVIPVVVQITFSLIAIAFYSKLVALWCLLTLILITLWSAKFSDFHRPLVKKNIENWDEQRKIRSESFQHLSLIKMLAAEDTFLKRYLTKREGIISFRISTFMYSMNHGYKRGFVMTLSRAGSTIIIFWQAVAGSITVGHVYALWSWINDAYSNIQNIIQVIRNLPIRFVELEKYLEITEQTPLFNESGSTYVNLQGDLKVKHLNFSYPYSERPVLSDVSLSIPHGKVTAFVGESGSGKSTIVKLLTRQYDYTDGSISIGGHEIKSFDAKILRSKLGYVEQHVELFDDTLRNNIIIGMARPSAISDDEIEDVAKHARITEFYHRLGEKKFETVVGERGIKLSGGERQRVGIARAIIKNPEILIFDEATSSLDTENEAKVMEAIKEVSEGKTTIIIAHRLSTIKDADQIIVMDKGRVVGTGSHEELLSSNEYYQNLVAHQV